MCLIDNFGKNNDKCSIVVVPVIVVIIIITTVVVVVVVCTSSCCCICLLSSTIFKTSLYNQFLLNIPDKGDIIRLVL